MKEITYTPPSKADIEDLLQLDVVEDDGSEHVVEITNTKVRKLTQEQLNKEFKSITKELKSLKKQIDNYSGDEIIPKKVLEGFRELYTERGNLIIKEDRRRNSFTRRLMKYIGPMRKSKEDALPALIEDKTYEEKMEALLKLGYFKNGYNDVPEEKLDELLLREAKKALKLRKL